MQPQWDVQNPHGSRVVWALVWLSHKEKHPTSSGPILGASSIGASSDYLSIQHWINSLVLFACSQCLYVHARKIKLTSLEWS